MKMYRWCVIALCSIGMLPIVEDGGAAAEGPVSALAPYVNDDTFVAGYFNLAALPQKDGQASGALISIFPTLGEIAQETPALKVVDQVIRSLRSAKVDAVYLVAGLGDLNTRGGPLVVVHLGAGGCPDDVARMLAPMVPGVAQWWPEFQVRPQGANIVLAGSKATLDRYSFLLSRERTDLLSPLKKLSDEGAVAAAVFCPGPDFRRVVRELWPELPGSLAPLRGELADRWLHVALAANAPPDAKPRLALQARDAAAAETFVKLLRSLPDAAEEFTDLGEQRHVLKEQLEMILEVLPPQQEDSRVTITFPSDEVQLAKLQPLLADTAAAALESSRRDRRMRQFKQLALAMLNYESARKHLPPAASRDEDGRPLLSWRVAVLPYLDEVELWKQFRLNEPWDSPHNRKLIDKMPAVFADPDPKLQKLARDGKTTYQVPVAPETVFHSDQGTTFKEIADGTSKTILIVEVEPARAVEWTKPQDWEVDLQIPRRGLQRDDRKYFTAAFADGHVEILDLDRVDDATLRALFTRAGGEVVDPQ